MEWEEGVSMHVEHFEPKIMIMRVLLGERGVHF